MCLSWKGVEIKKYFEKVFSTDFLKIQNTFKCSSNTSTKYFIKMYFNKIQNTVFWVFSVFWKYLYFGTGQPCPKGLLATIYRFWDIDAARNNKWCHCICYNRWTLWVKYVVIVLIYVSWCIVYTLYIAHTICM